jgi:hypothetical protein
VTEVNHMAHQTNRKKLFAIIEYYLHDARTRDETSARPETW